jgi:hypothetical protein
VSPGATVTLAGPVFDAKAAQTAQKRLGSAMYEAVMFMERKVKENTPVGVGGAQGGLVSTIGGEVKKGRQVLKGVVFTQSKYGEVIEKGRTPGQTMPPSGALIKWMVLKMGIDEATAQRLEFAVRRKIGRKGFPGAQMFEKSWDEYFPDIQRIFENAGFTIVKEMNG